MHRTFIRVVLAVALVLAGSAAGWAGEAPPDWRTKVDPWVLATAESGPTEFLVFLADQGDLRAAAGLPGKNAKGEFVYRTLREHAERTQPPVRRALTRLGVEWQPFWVANMIWVRGDLAVVQALAGRADVAHLYANPSVKLELPETEAVAAPAGPAAPDAIPWGVLRIRAPDVWALGVNGTGVVIGGQDTGYRWTHNALKNQYRGWDGSTANHNYNWHDAIHSGTSDCGANATAPCDDHGHGTHTMGTMLGDDGGANRIGVAPGAQWIACRNMREGVGTPATYSECYQWFIAPTPVSGGAGDPSKAPDVINNSWGCPASEGCTDPNVLLTVVQNVRAAGIVTVHSAGNEGAGGCSSVTTPAATYAASFSVGATYNKDTDGDGVGDADEIASYSSRGPVLADGSGRMKPNVSAPGSGVLSSYSSSDSSYTSMSGTSMAGPHVAGLVALLIDANEALRGDVDALETIVEGSALDKTTTQLCGSDTTTSVPNNVYGWGRVDALSAHQVATAPCTPPPVVADLSIALVDGNSVRLTWTPVAGAVHYEVSWEESPYFTPPPICDAGSCTTKLASPFTQDALGAAAHRTYTVQAVAACGETQATTPRVGEFGYALISGS